MPKCALKRFVPFVNKENLELMSRQFADADARVIGVGDDLPSTVKDASGIAEICLDLAHVVKVRAYPVHCKLSAMSIIDYQNPQNDPYKMLTFMCGK
jgi:hypothetical protein